jgi:hypothetical protein
MSLDENERLGSDASGRASRNMAAEGAHVATSDPSAEIIGDYRAFAAIQPRRRLVPQRLVTATGPNPLPR